MLSLLKTSPTARSRFGAASFCAALGLALVSTGCSNGDDDDHDDSDDAVATAFAATLGEGTVIPAPTSGTRVRVTVTNRAPANGTFQTPIWMGFHDGGFDTFDLNSPADLRFPTNNALEPLVEDGNTQPIQQAFTDQGFGSVQGVAEGVLGATPGPVAPGETVSIEFELDPTDPANRYFSFATMIIPSNDAFVSNGFATAFPIFDAGGNFVASDFAVPGSAALDAGTEVNDEFPASTMFFGQTSPNSGISELGNVLVHSGYLATGTGGILDDPMFVDADFTAPGYTLLAFRFEIVPAAPAAAGVATIGLDAAGDTAHVSIGAANLSGPATEVHVHMGAPGENGAVLLDLTDEIGMQHGGALSFEGSFDAPLALRDALLAGTAYVDVHTALNPEGELRGDVHASGSFTGTLDSAQEFPAPIAGRDVRVTVTNAAPDLGTHQMPVWIGFHDGGFDTHDLGAPAITYFPGTNALESIAEDGDTTLLVGGFTIQAFGTRQAVLSGVLDTEPGPLAPGETVSHVLRLDPNAASSAYMSYASMVIPSNDAFVANGDSAGIPVYVAGSFVAADFVVPGSAVLDAGTEVNDELPMNTAFFGQVAPNTGMIEGGSVLTHGGFALPGGGGILDDPDFVNADFTAPAYEMLRVRFDESEPTVTPTGLVIARISLDETQVEYSVFANGLSGPATAMHFHNGIPGEAGPVLAPLTGDIEVNSNGMLTAAGTTAVDAGFLEALRAGNVYLNVHTALNPSGEIRGQLVLLD